MAKEQQQELPQEFSFDADALSVAIQMRGAVIFAGDRIFMIMDARGFTSEEIRRAQFGLAHGEQTGVVTGSPYRGTTLANISTGEGGLVMPTAVREIISETQSHEIVGPGRVAEALGIGNNEKYRLAVENSLLKVFRLLPVQLTS
jgi:hypothetical protein